MSAGVPQLLFVRRVLRLAWFVLGALLLGWIIWRNVPPNGLLTATGRTAEPNGFIGGFTPLDRAKPVQENGAWYSDVVNEPVYFHLAAPRLYDTMRVRLRYKNDGQPFIGLGARTDLAEWSFDVKPIDLPMLDQSGWAARQVGEYRIYERKATQRSLRELLDAASRVAVVNIDSELPVLTWETDLKKSPYDAVVARYHPPMVDADGWRTAEAEFDLDHVAASQGRVQMVFSLPAIKTVGGTVRVERVDVTYARPPLDPRKLLDLFKLQL